MQPEAPPLNEPMAFNPCKQHSKISLEEDKAKEYAQHANLVPSATKASHSAPTASGGRSAASTQQRLLSSQKLLAYDNPAAFHYLRLNSHITGRQPHVTRYQHGLPVLHAYNHPQKKSHSRTNMCYTSSSHSRLSISLHADQTVKNPISLLQTITTNAP